jgi:23S rRNA pseudouridine1911/1915/1917 synthase
MRSDTSGSSPNFEPDHALPILHCDNHVLAVNKPAGCPSVPDASGDASAFDIARRSVEKLYGKPGRAWLATVNRLDRPVSGILLFGRTTKGARRLSAAMAARDILKVYWGLLPAAAGPAGSHGRVHQWLRKDRTRNMVQVVGRETPGAKEALTDWRVLERGAAATLVEFRCTFSWSLSTSSTARVPRALECQSWGAGD